MYHSIKLNVPPDKADAIKSLVPPGAPVSGTLIAILLDVAASRENSEQQGPTEATHLLQKRVAALERKLSTLSDRLDYIARPR